MATPPIDAPVLYEIESNQITFRFKGNSGPKINGNKRKVDRMKDRYKLVMEGVEKVHWDTRDDDEEGNTNAATYVDNFKKNYGKNAKVDAYQLFTLANGDKKKIRFEMSNPRYNKRNDVLTYDIAPKSKKQLAKITGLEGETLAEGNLYSTESTRWRPDWWPNGRERDLRGADLRDADLRKIDLAYANLTDADLSRADLFETHLWRAKLNRAVMKDADLRGAKLGGADLSRADLSGAEMNGAELYPYATNLTRANLSKANLENSVLAGVNFTNADLRDTILRNANMEDAVLKDAKLSDSNLTNAIMYHVDFTDADLRLANMTGARNFGGGRDNLNKAIFGGTICPNGTLNVGTNPCTFDLF